MVKFEKPDWKCVFTYVQTFYRRFRHGREPPVATKKLTLSTPVHLSPPTLAKSIEVRSFSCQTNVPNHFPAPQISEEQGRMLRKKYFLSEGDSSEQT